jgi:quercetin dioxygenase-like cupin family protein
VDVEIGGPDGALTTHRMRVGDTLHIRPGTRHRIIAVEDSDIFEVSTPEGEDVIRISDRYGRAPA